MQSVLVGMVGDGGENRGREEVKGLEKEVGCRFDGFSYSSTEINYSGEACMVAELMAHAADKSTSGLEPLCERRNSTRQT